MENEKFQPGDEINLDPKVQLKNDVFAQVAEELRQNGAEVPSFEEMLESIGEVTREISVEGVSRGSTLTSTLVIEENLTNGSQSILRHTIKYSGSIPKSWSTIDPKHKIHIEGDLRQTMLSALRPNKDVESRFKPSQRKIEVHITFTRAVGDYDIDALHDRLIRTAAHWRETIKSTYKL